MQIALCDDNKDWLSTETDYIDRINDSSLRYDVFANGEELINSYKQQGCIYDAIFLDMEMEMNGLNGIDTANIIRSMDRSVLIVFVTSYRKYMQESFECLPFRFLLKPISFNEFKATVHKIINELEEDKRALIFSEKRDVIRLLYEEIVFMQSVGHCICIKTIDKLYRSYSFSLTDIQEKLNSGNFVRVHKSYIINIRHIYKISGNKVMMKYYNHDIPVSGTYRDELKRKVILFEERKHLS